MSDDCIMISLGLEGYKVLAKAETEQFCLVTVEKTTVTESCRGCGQQTDRVHDRRWQTVKDIWVKGKPIWLRLRKRRFRCSNGCPAFIEASQVVRRYARMTNRLVKTLVFEPEASFRELSRRHGVGEGAVSRAFLREANGIVSQRESEPFAVLGIDENSFRKRLRYNTVLTDLGRNRLVDVLPGKSPEVIEQWLKGFKYRALIRFVVTDLHIPFVKAVQRVCPWVIPIADKFHLVAQVNRQLCAVKRECHQAGLKSIGNLYWLLVAARESLTDEEKVALEKALVVAPKLAQAYELKEQFRALYASGFDREQAQAALMDWMIAAAQSGFKGFRSYCKTVHQRQQMILNWFDFHTSNGYTEGVNNKLKLIKRTAYGFKRFETFRLKALLSVGRVA